jgi:hypothetical protein
MLLTGDILMADMITDLASKCDISPEMARKGLGAVLALFKNHLPADTFSKISAAVPGADNAMAAAELPGESSGGVASTIKGALGKLFGGGGAAAELASRLAQAGFSADQLRAFLAKVMEFFKSKLPGEVTEQVSGLLATPEESAR